MSAFFFASVAYSNSEPSACALLTNTDVAKALGTEIESRASGNTPHARLCIWHGKPLSAFTSSGELLVLLVTTSSKLQFETQAPPGSVQIRGLGGLAYTAGGPHTLVIWKNDVAVSFTVTFASSPVHAAESLAKIVLKHL